MLEIAFNTPCLVTRHSTVGDHNACIAVVLHINELNKHLLCNTDRVFKQNLYNCYVDCNPASY